ncbi:MAG: hypothetical protein ACOC5T_06160 [Elusimicrobiota bacterium]
MSDEECILYGHGIDWNTGKCPTCNKQMISEEELKHAQRQMKKQKISSKERIDRENHCRDFSGEKK